MIDFSTSIWNCNLLYSANYSITQNSACYHLKLLFENWRNISYLEWPESATGITLKLSCSKVWMHKASPGPPNLCSSSSRFPFSSFPPSNPRIPFWKLALSNYVDMKRKIVGTLSLASLVISSHFYRIGRPIFPNSRNASLVKSHCTQRADSLLVYQYEGHQQIEREICNSKTCNGKVWSIKFSRRVLSHQYLDLSEFLTKKVLIRSTTCDKSNRFRGFVLVFYCG